MKVAVVGLDSADWSLLDRWLHHLPHIAQIRRDGVSGPLASTRPPVTIPAWKSYSTGKNPGKLGIFWFAHPDFEEQRLRINLPGGIGGNLWDFIPNSLVVNTPGTFPPRLIDGVLIAGFPCPEGQPFATPESILPQLSGYRVNTRIPPGGPGYPDEAMELISMRFDTFLRFAPRFDFGQVTIFVIDELHHLYGSDSVVLDAWRLIDEGIGRVMAVADNVVLVSDHSSGPLKHFLNVVPALKEIGAFRVRGRPWKGALAVADRLHAISPPGVHRAVERVVPRKVRDAARTRLAPMEHWLASTPDQFRVRVDWTSTAIPLNQGLVYRNPAAARGGPLMSEVETALRGLPSVARVWRRDELYSGPLLKNAPELWVETDAGVEVAARFDDAWITRRPEKGREWIVNHRQHGIYGFLGQDVEPQKLDGAAIYDMCPTILSFYGIPTPATVDGRPLPVLRKTAMGRPT